MNTQENKGYYIRIDDQDITVSKEIRDAWNKPKDKTWYEARKIGACRCPSFRICTGDCGTCKWNTQGKVISYDDERYHDLFVNGCTARSLKPVEEIPDPSEIIADEDRFSRILRQADRLCECGSIIFQLHYRKYSTHEISAETGIPQKTVYRRLQKILLRMRSQLKPVFLKRQFIAGSRRSCWIFRRTGTSTSESRPKKFFELFSKK